MKFENAIRVLAATMAMSFASAPTIAGSPDPTRDPRAAGLSRIGVVREAAGEIVRIDRAPDGSVRRCVQAAHLVPPVEGGPSRVEFGIERAGSESATPPDLTMFFRIRFVDGAAGKPLPVNAPVLEIYRVRPTSEWSIEIQPGGWIRRSKSAARSDEDERDGFLNEVRRGLNDIVSTFPDGTHRWHSVRGSGSPWHFNMFVDCACRLAADLPKETRDWLLCPEPRRN